MELKTNLIHRNFTKCEAKTQLTIGDDYSVPEGKPDIAGILQKKAELSVEEVHTEKGKIRIRGTLKMWVLYLAERSSDTISSLAMEFPFDEILYMDGAANGDNLKIDWQIEDLRVTIIHPGKLSVRGIVTLYGTITTAESHLIAEAIEEGQNIHSKVSSFTVAEPVLDKRDSYRIRDEITLPAGKPNVRSVLWKDLQVRGLDIRIQEGRLAIKGELLVFIIYQGEDEREEVQWLEQSMPFQGTLDMPNLTMEMFGTLEPEISHRNIELKPDYDGEMRMFQLEAMIDLPMHFYEERTLNKLEDAYSTQEQLNLVTEEAAYEKLRMCNQTKCRISTQEHLEDDLKILQLLGHQAQLQNQHCKMAAEGLLCEGSLEVQVLYITSNDRQPFGIATVSTPYSQLIEIPEIQKDDLWKVHGCIDQLFVTMPESNLLEIRAILNFDACVMEQCRLTNITNLTSEPYDMEAYKKAPGMVIHFVQPSESLWQIAKQNRSTVEEIKKVNDIAAEDVVPGQKLLLVKAVAEPMAH